MTAKPKRLFRIHRNGREPLPAVEAWVEANRSRFRPGTLTQVTVEHDERCRYPSSGRCTCRTGPTIRVRDENPEEN
jgi:hypothetical protein